MEPLSFYAAVLLKVREHMCTLFLLLTGHLQKPKGRIARGHGLDVLTRFPGCGDGFNSERQDDG